MIMLKVNSKKTGNANNKKSINFESQVFSGTRYIINIHDVRRNQSDEKCTESWLSKEIIRNKKI